MSLDAAREHLARKGYLRPSLPPAPPPLGRRVLHASLFSVALAMVTAWTAGGTESPSPAVLALAAGLLPVVLATVAAAVPLGIGVTRVCLRLGATPELASGVAGALGGAAALALMTAAAGQRPSGLWPAVVPWVGGVLLAVHGTLMGRAALLRHFSFAVEPPSARRFGPLVPAAAVVIIGAILSATSLLTGRGGSAAATASFLPPHGRVAVIAVDGLAREEVEALATAEPGRWGTIAGWGWAPLADRGLHAPAVLWTTVACGVSPAVHGVVVLDEVRLFGTESGVPLTGLVRSAVVGIWHPLGLARVVARPALARRAPTVWEMASRAGCPVTVGGWWGSWPVRRVLGEVVSERAWLGGSIAADAVSPPLVELVSAAWADGSPATVASDRLAEWVSQRAAGAGEPHLTVVWMPALDLIRRSSPSAPPIALAARAGPHVVAVANVVSSFARSGDTVWLVAAPWSGGTPFVACAAAPPGERPAVDPRSLAATWLAQLGLPRPAGAAPARSDLVPIQRVAGAPADYGPPPPPLAAPPEKALEVQRELLRNLGYLQ